MALISSHRRQPDGAYIERLEAVWVLLLLAMDSLLSCRLHPSHAGQQPVDHRRLYSKMQSSSIRRDRTVRRHSRMMGAIYQDSRTDYRVEVSLACCSGPGLRVMR